MHNRTKYDIYLHCTCPIYNLIQRAGHHETQLSQGKEVILNHKLTCMHCRFYCHHLVDMYDSITTQRSAPLSHIQSKINTSLQYMNMDVQLAGKVIYTGTTKFSCKSFDSLAIVNITFSNGKSYARCTQGTCAANFKNKHNIHHRDEECESTHIHCHLQTLFSNLENFKSFFPDFFVSSDEQIFIQRSTVSNNEEVNRDDQILSQTKIHGGFNKEKGIWEYPSVTMHKPKEMMNEHLVNCTEERNDYIHSTKMDTTTGLFQTFHLKASTTTKENTEIQCQCGTNYHTEGIYKDRGVLYT